MYFFVIRHSSCRFTFHPARSPTTKRYQIRYQRGVALRDEHLKRPNRLMVDRDGAADRAIFFY